MSKFKEVYGKTYGIKIERSLWAALISFIPLVRRIYCTRLLIESIGIVCADVPTVGVFSSFWVPNNTTRLKVRFALTMETDKYEEPTFKKALILVDRYMSKGDHLAKEIITTPFRQHQWCSVTVIINLKDKPNE